MFSYYGSKSKIIQYYAEPRYSTIIEPFAGSARYALRYFDRNIILIDKYPVIVKLWKYLQQCSPNDILSLPVPEKGESLKMNKYKYLSDDERALLGFHVQSGVNAPRHTVSKVGNFYTWPRDRQRIADNLYKIKHWHIVLGEYDCVQNLDATWYIDPPYQVKGFYYRHSKIDYSKLGDWCKTRMGQSIVCESLGADWLNFRPLKELSGQRHKTMEVVWEQ